VAESLSAQTAAGLVASFVDPAPDGLIPDGHVDRLAYEARNLPVNLAEHRIYRKQILSGLAHEYHVAA
jgi:hypothetical protein